MKENRVKTSEPGQRVIFCQHPFEKLGQCHLLEYIMIKMCSLEKFFYPKFSGRICRLKVFFWPPPIPAIFGLNMIHIWNPGQYIVISNYHFKEDVSEYSGHVIALVKPVQPSTADLREEHELVRLWWQEYKRLCGDEEKVGMERMVVLPWPEVGDWEDDVERVGGRKG